MTRPAVRNGVRSSASPSSVVSGRRNWSRWATVQPSSVKTDIGTTISSMTPSSQACGRLLLRGERERVRVLARQVREGVVEVLGGLAHHRGGLVDDPLRDEARVEVDVLAHRVVAHVLDAADEDDVSGAHRDLARARRRRGQRAGAHAVDREPGNALREPREERDVAAERQALVADLRRRGEDDVVDLGRRQGRVAAEQLAHGLHAHVVRARLPEVAALARAAERRADAVDVHHLAQGAGHRRDDTSHVETDWEERAARAIERHDDGAARLPEDGDERQRQLTRMGNAAWAAGLSFLMAGRRDEGAAWLVQAAERYRESWPLAPPGSWGRPIGAMKSRLIAGDRSGAQRGRALGARGRRRGVGESDRALRGGARAARSRRRRERGSRDAPGTRCDPCSGR